ncbi:MAG: hypothetical protein RSD99_01800 [Janthinobacterium sp.]
MNRHSRNKYSTAAPGERRMELKQYAEKLRSARELIFEVYIDIHHPNISGGLAVFLIKK